MSTKITKQQAQAMEKFLDAYLKECLITVVIPVYKRAKELRQALSSLVAQTNDHFIVAVVDDHSPNEDEIRAVCDEFAGYLFIRYIRKAKNEGCGPARQVGIDTCTTPYVAFLDDDDTYGPNTINVWDSIIRDNLRQHAKPIDILCNRFVYEEKTDRPSVPYAEPQTDQDIAAVIKDLEESSKERNRIYEFAEGGSFLCGKCYRMEYLANNYIQFHPELRRVEDTCFNIQAFSFNPNVTIDDYVAYHWHNNPNGLHTEITYQDTILCVKYAALNIYRGGRVLTSEPLARGLAMLYEGYFKYDDATTEENAALLREIFDLLGADYIDNKRVKRAIRGQITHHSMNFARWAKQFLPNEVEE